MLRVKICGITRMEDARIAVREGADAIGFVFADSPRRARPETVQKIVRSLGLSVTAVGVFVDENVEKMLQVAGRCALHVVQLHGNESENTTRRLRREGFGVIRAVRVVDGENLKRFGNLSADALLFDTSQGGRFGGIGRSFDWEILKKENIDRPWIVSGGLNPQNVRKLLKVLRPYGVDVSSGVETAPGIKNEKRVKEFIRNAKSAG